MSDPATYRTKEELNEYKKQDPILNLKTHMLEKKLITEEGFSKLDKERREAVEEAAKFAEESPQPAPEELYEDVFAGEGAGREAADAGAAGEKASGEDTAGTKGRGDASE